MDATISSSGLVVQVVDSSIVIASLVHADAALRTACRQHVEACPQGIAHVITESYARMTAMPGQHRLAPSVAVQVLGDMFTGDPLILSGAGHIRVIDLMARMGVPGGAVFDALIAETAREHHAVLVSLDRRAATTYAAVGADFTVI
jgi:predicted nucleic acid-binding protein